MLSFAKNNKSLKFIEKKNSLEDRDLLHPNMYLKQIKSCS
jgi:hypothetical protein